MTGTGPMAAEMHRLLTTSAPISETSSDWRLRTESVIFCLLDRSPNHPAIMTGLQQRPCQTRKMAEISQFLQFAQRAPVIASPKIGEFHQL
jgi:hypothetical protein